MKGIQIRIEEWGDVSLWTLTISQESKRTKGVQQPGVQEHIISPINCEFTLYHVYQIWQLVALVKVHSAVHEQQFTCIVLYMYWKKRVLAITLPDRFLLCNKGEGWELAMTKFRANCVKQFKSVAKLSGLDLRSRFRSRVVHNSTHIFLKKY